MTYTGDAWIQVLSWDGEQEQVFEVVSRGSNDTSSSTLSFDWQPQSSEGWYSVHQEVFMNNQTWNMMVLRFANSGYFEWNQSVNLTSGNWTQSFSKDGTLIWVDSWNTTDTQWNYQRPHFDIKSKSALLAQPNSNALARRADPTDEIVLDLPHKMVSNDSFFYEDFYYQKNGDKVNAYFFLGDAETLYHAAAIHIDG